MNTHAIFDVLPALYRGFLPAFLESPIPREEASTCANCAMVREDDGGSSGLIYYLKNVKCCTHYPNLPNYLLGALLSDRDPAMEGGRRRIRKLIKSRIGVTPRGIRRSEKVTLLLRNAPEAFGKSKTLRCPFYEPGEGKCTIRPFWDAICVTWFCKYSAGEDGRLFWLGLRKYLENLEDTLVQYTLHTMSRQEDAPPLSLMLPEARSQTSITPRELDGQPTDPVSYGRLWGNWMNGEEEFYVRTFKLVSELTQEAFENIAGISSRVLLEEVKSRQKNLVSPVLPLRLKRNPRLWVDKKGEDSYFLIAYSPLDPLIVSARIYQILDFFDGNRTYDEVCRIIKEKIGAEPARDLLLSLYQTRILVETDGGLLS